MGAGYGFVCKKCGCEYGAHPGIGMGYPSVYRDLVKKILAGKYGEEYRKLFKETPYAAINGETHTYVCANCGNWNDEENLTLYAPNDAEEVAKIPYGEKTVKERGYIPYAMERDLKEHFHAIRRYRHHCSKCGHIMHQATEEESRHLPCPECGEKNEPFSMIMWD